MATPAEKLAEALKVLQTIQDKGIVAIKSDDLSRTNKDRLITNGFIREVVRGWYIAVNPEEKKGNSTSWFTSYWGFCSRFLEDRYGDEYCISAEQSLLLHSGNEVVPNQMIIRSVKGTNNLTQLLFNTSLFSMKSPLSELESVEIKNGLRILNLPSSIIYGSPSIFVSNPIDVRTALSMINDASEILSLLLDKGHSLKAGRIVGAFRNILLRLIVSHDSLAIPEVSPARYTFSPTSISSISSLAPAAMIISNVASMISGPIPSPLATVILFIFYGLFLVVQKSAA